MLKKRVEYTDYLGQSRTKDLYFNLSKSDVTRMMMLETSFATKEDGTVENRNVQVLAAHEGYSAIGKGIQLGETVITDGHLRLTPGAKIKAKGAGDGEKKDKADAVQQSDSKKKD